MGEVVVDVLLCLICGRRFVLDRFVKYEKVCIKVVNFKRKVYDIRKYRSKGIDYE